METLKEHGALAWASENRPESCDSIERLYSWSSNYGDFAPFRKFLDLIGYGQEEGFGLLSDWSNPADSLGYIEAGYLGEALVAYSERPAEVGAFITELLEVEGEFGL